ncbi:LrgB family protein [Bacillus sp. MUM 13]|uniref:LrgB family protein n=1 Tax=Bacillus sp. MUM 13 TaxID=1678001 RepID=UPI0008F5746A|nr:LrgB family protein [Bacillus sp. MUM 13]OIK08415.1 CidB/LrgB family autolysis modulator [Bacillus sp. MUM 13]
MGILHQIISIIITIMIYMVSKKVYNRWTVLLFSPILVCPIVLIMLITSYHSSFSAYNEGAQWLTKLLGPATVAFAVPMHKHFQLLKKHGAEIILSLAVGALTAISSSFLLAQWMKLSPFLIKSLVPRSITTPIAMNISSSIGGAPAMTAVFVIITGLTGTMLGPVLIRLTSIRTPQAMGLLLGMGAHGAGASKAYEIGELEGTFASLAIVMAAIISIIMVSVIFH